MADFKKSVDALQFIKELSMPQQAGKIVKASDAYAPFADQGIFTAPTMADRTIASPKGKLKGGMRFPYLQNVDPAYEGEVWGFGAGNMSTKLLNQFENVPSDKLLLSTILGNKYMHHSNPEVSADLIKQYRKGIKSGNLSDELRDKTNRRINQLTDEDGNPIFAPDSDVTDPAFYRSLDTFDKRAAMGNIMGGVGLNEGAERKRRVANQIFDYEGLMRKMTEPSIIGAPNSSIGSRIFTLSGTKSERPDLNKAYPHVVGGLDLNVDFGQVPFQHYLKDYTDNMMQTRGKVPGWFNLTRSSDLPTQEITDQWLQHLKNRGYADGGQVEHMQAGGVKKAIGALGEMAQAAPKKITHGMLRRRGMEIGNKEEADALYSSGHRIFGMHELDEVPFEITDRKLFDSYAPDMMLAYPPDKPLLKAEGGSVEHMQAGGAMGLLEKIAAMRAANTAVKTPKLLAPLERQYALEQFKAGSADPRQFYHGSRQYYTDDVAGKTIRVPDEGIRNLQTPSQLKNWNYENNADAVFLTPESSFSNAFAGDIKDELARPAVYPVHAQVKNPFDIHNQDHAKALIDTYRRMHIAPDDVEKLGRFEKDVAFAQRDPANWATLENNRVQDAIKSLGHDSFYVTENGVKNLGVYNPNLVKSSLGNRGTFDINEADMTKAEGGAVHSQAEDGDIMRQLFDHALDKGDIHEMTHAMLVKQHEAEYG